MAPTDPFAVFPAVHQEGEGTGQHRLYTRELNSNEMSRVPEVDDSHPILLRNRFILLQVQKLQQSHAGLVQLLFPCKHFELLKAGFGVHHALVLSPLS